MERLAAWQQTVAFRRFGFVYWNKLKIMSEKARVDKVRQGLNVQFDHGVDVKAIFRRHCDNVIYLWNREIL